MPETKDGGWILDDSTDKYGGDKYLRKGLKPEDKNEQNKNTAGNLKRKEPLDGIESKK